MITDKIDEETFFNAVAADVARCKGENAVLDTVIKESDEFKEICTPFKNLKRI